MARKLGKIPSVHEYESAGRFSNMPFHTRYRHWTRIPQAFLKFARASRVEAQWSDVLKLVAAQTAREAEAARARLKPRVRKGPVLPDRPVFGAPLLLPGMAFAPTNDPGSFFSSACSPIVSALSSSISRPSIPIARQCAKSLEDSGSAFASSSSLRVATFSSTATRAVTAI